MKKILLNIILLFSIAGFFSGCSTEKNTRASRAYHNLTARYNIYFNGKQSLKAGLARIDKTVVDDFTRILPVYKESYNSAGTAARADMNNAILKGSKLIQLHSITKKPKRQRLRTRHYKEFASKEEFNNWIDDSYLLIGRAYYYQHNFGSAIDNFSYILRKFPDEKIRYDAMVWLIRSYSEMERFSEASEMIQSLQSDKQFPRRLDKELAIATADMYLKQKDYQEAIRFLDISIKKCFWKKEKARLQYILAQLYQETGDNVKATEAFQMVRKYNPPYKMEFNARINAAGLFSGQGDPEKLKKELQKMLRDEKNLEFRDQIYFALANIYYKQGDHDRAVENYRKSVSSSVSNTFQLALSSVTLADIYFKEQSYKNSQTYYDSAMRVIDKEYPNYEKLNQRYNSLTHLVENLNIIEVQDSLQKLALMPEADRNTLINKWIAVLKEKQRQEEIRASREQAERGYYQANEYRFGLGTTDQSTEWYFYNPQTVSYGKAQFQQRWGKRKLEDDWRRSNKGIVSGENTEEVAALADSTKKAMTREKDPLQPKYYTQDLPVNDSLMAISNEKIRDALYNAGKIFKSDFSDYPRSANSYENLNTRFPENIYLLSSWFDLYDLYELMGDHTKSQNYHDLIIGRYPESKYARYLQNPNFFTDMEAEKDSLNRIYQNAFRDYKTGRYSAVTSAVTKMKKLEPDTVLKAKIDFMGAVSQGAGSDMPNFEKQLKNYIGIYPKSEPTPLAREILKLIQDSTLTDYQKLVDMGYLHNEIHNNEIESANQQATDEFGGKFSYDEDLLHYFVIAYPKNPVIEINRLKYDIANYNLDHYTKIDFDIDEENLDSNNKLLVIRSLQNKEQGLIYFRAIIRQSEVFKTLKNNDYVNFIISSTNYREILSEKSIADYLKFYLKNYSRFIGPDFKNEGTPEESPEELMARAQRENDALKEKGKFVTVDIPVIEGQYSLKIDTTQCFVLGVKDKNLSLRSLLLQFAEFDRDQFKTWNLALQIKQAGEYQFIVVKGLPGYIESMSYFRKVIMERSLFKSLGQIIYRNFVITDENLEKILQKGDVDSYLNFFRTNYIRKAGQVPVIQQQETPSGKVTGTQTTVPDTMTAAYSGPYNISVEKPHYFVLIVPAEGFNKADLVAELKKFNDSAFKESGLIITEKPLDEIRNIIQVEGLANITLATGYLSQVVSNRAIYAPLGNLSYRNFIITADNYEIFLKRKNITEYLDFYKKVYLKK